MGYCGTKSEHIENMKHIEDAWNKDRTITDQFGHYKEGNKIAETQLRELVWERTGKYYDEDIFLSKQEAKVIGMEIKDISKRIRSGNISTVEMVTLVPDAIHGRLPSSRKFLNELNLAVNYERTSREFFLKQKALLAEELKFAFIADGVDVGYLSNPVIKKLRELESKYAAADEQQLRSDYYAQIETLVNSNEGKIIRQYTEALELPFSELNTVESLKKYPPHVLSAVKQTRKLLGTVDKKTGKIDGLGKILMDGLDNSVRAALLRFTNQDSRSNILASKTQNPRLYHFIKEVDAAKARIKEGIDQGGYMPHLGLDQIVRMKDSLKKVNNSIDVDAYKALEDMSAPNGSLHVELGVPREAKARADVVKRFFSRDPLFVIEQYANDVIVFNRDTQMKVDYVKALKNLGKEGNSQFIRSMRKYLQMQYERSTLGTNQSDSKVNRLARTITAAETIKSMAFGLAGAGRNFISGAYHFMHLSQNGIARSSRLLGDRNMSEVINEVIKEQGFEFKEAGGALAEGLLPEGGIKTSDLRLRMTEDGSAFVEVQKETGTWDKVDAVMQEALNKSLVFHRWGENALRRHMFRHAFASTYDAMTENVNFMNKPNKDGIINEKTINSREKIARKMATLAGIQSVEKWAFEYSIHHKAPIISGIATGKGTAFDVKGNQGTAIGGLTTAGAVMGQFLHYPMEFAAAQFRAVKRSGQSMVAGDGLAEKFYNQDSKNVVAFAGVSGLVHALSLAFNTDLKHLLENDTLNRLTSMAEYFDDDLSEEDKSYHNGLIQEITGPFVQDAMFAANVSGLYQLPDAEWGKMILGYTDYYEMEGDELRAATMRRIMPNQLAKWTNRIIPDVFVDGGGISTYLMHEFGVYPKAWTRKQRKYLGFGKKKKKKGKDDLTQLAQDLRGMKR